MLTIRAVVSIFLVVMMGLGPGVVSAQNYPSKPIRILTTAAGSFTDIISRLIAQGISGPLGQPVIVENRPSNLIGELLGRATPDGYTAALGGAVLWITPLLQKVSYDAVRDFSSIAWISSSVHVLVVHPAVPVKSVKELIALAKARPGELNYAQGPSGGATHLAGALFTSMAGIKMVFIPYTDSAASLNAMIAGESHVMIINAATGIPQVKSGRLRALAVTSPEPTPLVPGIPTVAASGLPGYESITAVGIFAPIGTPAMTINQLNQEIVRVLNRADVKEKFFSYGASVVGSSPAQFAAKIKSELATWGKVIKDAGIRAE